MPTFIPSQTKVRCGANLAVRWPQREGPFSDGERKSVGRVPYSAERRKQSSVKDGRPLKSDPQPPFVPAVVSRLADAESVGIFVATDLPQCNWPAGPHPEAYAPSAALRDGPFPRTNPRLTYSQSSQGPRSRGVIMLTIASNRVS